MFKKATAAILSLALVFSFSTFVASASDSEYTPEYGTNSEAENNDMGISALPISTRSAVLMDADSGTVLYSSNANEALPPASVTKIMTLLLVCEALGDGRINLNDNVRVSANAASMGGSQVFLKEGEEFTVEELLKSTVIASANDAAVALAELVAGSEDRFVTMMNEKAKALDMKNTVFENATGLDESATRHLTSAYDIALMSRELIKHEQVMRYSNVWQDSIRNGEFTLTNTNRLVRYYSGCTGLKTGSTDKAGFCVSATAERDGMHLIAVIMGSDTRDDRNNSARMLLDYGFANYGVSRDGECDLETIPVKRGALNEVTAYSNEFSILTDKANMKSIEKRYDMPLTVTAPITKGSKIGEVVYTLNGNEIGRCDICAREDVERISLYDIYLLLLKGIIIG